MKLRNVYHNSVVKYLSAVTLIPLLFTNSLYGQWSNTNYHLSFNQGNNVDQRISMNKPNSLSNGKSPFTIETWVRLDGGSCPDNKPTSNDAFVSIGDHKSSHQGAFGGAEIGIQACCKPSNGGEPVFGNSAGLKKFYFVVGDGSSNKAIVSSDLKPNCNQWYHIAGVYTGTEIKMYVDGVLQSSTSTVSYSGNVNFPNDMNLGREAVPTGSKQGYLDGDLDNVAIWNSAKTYTTSNYDDPITHNSSDLIDYYHFNQSSHSSTSPPLDANSNSGNVVNNGSNVNGVTYVGTGSGAPLPVELLYFESQLAANHNVILNWATVSEINNSHFEIERSYNGRTFERVGEVNGNGNSQHQIDYSYLDESIKLLNYMFEALATR